MAFPTRVGVRNRILARGFFIGLALILGPHAHAATAPVGATPGQFAVNEHGGATYTIPIVTPPGSAGMTPQVSLHYNKQVQNDLVGLGWSIGGLSVITRCGRTIALDGVKGGVNLDSNDRFCLDGQRLLAVSGAYGADGTEYRTERESFSRIFSYGAQGSGPAYFKVLAPNGTMTEYGVTADARIEAQGQVTVRLWAANKVQDSKGNYLTVSYTEDNANGEYRPTRIDYTGNAGLAPYNSIRFTYAARPDIVPAYEAGSLIKVTQRLTTIQTFADLALAREYRLSYDNNGAAGRSRLVSVTECGADGVCLAPTLAGWQNGGQGFASNPGAVWGANGDSNTDLNRYQTGDFDGDGRIDALFIDTDGSYHVRLSTGGGFSSAIWGANGNSTTDVGRYRTGDFNGDGKTDVLFINTNGSFHVRLSTGGGFTSDAGSVWGVAEEGTTDHLFGDFNGDGRTDIVHLGIAVIFSNPAFGDSFQNYHVRLSTGSSFAEESFSWLVADISRFRTGDFNGDGRTDLLYIQPDGTYRMRLSTGTGATGTEIVISDGNGDGTADLARYKTGDFNGDGKIDLLYLDTNGTLYVRLSTGTGLLPNAQSVWGSTGNGAPERHQLADVNGDGRTDVLYLDPDGTYRVWTSGGGGFAASGAQWGERTTRTNVSFVLYEEFLIYIPARDLVTSTGTVLTTEPTRHRLADFNGDGKTDLLYIETNGEYYVNVANGAAPDMLASVTNALGHTTQIAYSPLTASGAYARDAGSVYPYVDVQNATYVVSRVTQSDGLGGQYGMTYHYGGAKSHLTGPGWLGFRWQRTTDERTGVITEAHFNQLYDGTHGTPNYTESRIGATVMSRQDHFWTPINLGAGRTLARADGTLSQTYELNGAPVTCASADNTYRSFDAAGDFGDYGNPIQVLTKTDVDCSFANAFTQTTASTYSHNTTNWILGQVTQAGVTHAAPGQPSITKTSSFTYDSATGLVTSETIEPNTGLSLTTGYTYDSFGNRTSQTVSGPDITTRTSTTAYDTRGRFAETLTNALGHTAGSTYDPKWGEALTQTDANGLTVSWTYDGFGRKLTETRPDGTATTITYAACDTANPCPVLAQYLITTTQPGAAPSTAYYDRLGRVIRGETQGLDGTKIYQDTEYNALGQVARAAHPYFASESIHWTSYAYDAAGRAVSKTDPDGGVSTTTYNGLTTIATNPLNQTKTIIKNAAGKTVQATDALGNSLTYTHDATGNLLQVTDPAGNTTAMAYDVRGRKTGMTDPDMGSWSYAYNALGQLISQTDAKGQTQTVTYDVLGRMVSRTNGEGTSTWAYDTAPQGTGKLAHVTGPGGFTADYTYDSLGRVSAVTTTINSEPYTVTRSYDALGRPATIEYPQTGFTVRQDYNALGFLTELRNAGTNALYWQATNADAHGRIINETYGNGLTSQRLYDHQSGDLLSIHTAGSPGIIQDLSYTFDLLGNLVSRTDHPQSLIETFTYDALNRLTQAQGAVTKTYQYDAIGNITYKSDVGSYTYGPKPHAVASTSGILNTSYTYDANGNMVSGAGRTIAWTSFNKPSQITTSTASTAFQYDANHNRIQKQTISNTTVYIGKLYERLTQGPLTEHKHYLYAGRSLIGIYTERSTAVNDTRYVHSDHLDSLDTLTDESGNIVEKLAFDPHGKRRNPDGTDATAPITSSTTKGFTHHEHDDEVGLINMNARLYDPILGRFLSPDTFIQAPSHTQSYNRYTYAFNNPLALTDPSGHWSLMRTLRRNYHNIVGTIKVVTGAVLIYASQFTGPFQSVVAAAGAAIAADGAHDINGCKCGVEIGPIPIFEQSFGPGGYREPGVPTEPNARTGGGGGGLLQVLSVGPDDWFSIDPIESGVDSSLVCMSWGMCINPDGVIDAVELSTWLLPGGALLQAGGRILGWVRNVDGGFATVERILSMAEKWLGPGYKQVGPGRFRSADGARQFRMTDRDLLDKRQGPHVHFESIGPNGRVILENSHVRILGEL